MEIYHEKIFNLKKQIEDLRQLEIEETRKLILPFIQENCVFKISWINHMIYCDKSMDNPFKEKFEKLGTAKNEIHRYYYYFAPDLYLFYNGQFEIGRSEYDYSCSIEEYMRGLLKQCKQLQLNKYFNSVKEDIAKYIKTEEDKLSFINKMEEVYNL